LGQDAPQDPQALVLPSVLAPHLGQEDPCMVVVWVGVYESVLVFWCLVSEKVVSGYVVL